MKLYLLIRKTGRVFEDYDSMAVRARNFHEARTTASIFVKTAEKELDGSFDHEVWTDPNRSDVREIEPTDEPQVLLAHFEGGR